MRADGSYARIDAVDALRGIAASSVVLQHIYGIHKLPADNWLMWLVGHGLGVPLFFAVSAFCLYYAMERHEGGAQSPVAFYARRFFRIAPLYYAMLLFYVVMLYATRGKSYPEDKLWHCVTFVFAFVEQSHTGIVWASWTIGIEMAFYALFPLIYAFVRNWKKAVMLFILCMVIAQAAALVFPYIAEKPKAYYNLSFFRHLPFFGAGILAYQILFAMAGRVHRKLAGAAALLASFLLIALYRLVDQGALAYHGVAIACGLAVLGVTLWPMALLVNPVTRFLGRISYSLYLAHPPIIYYSKPIYLWIYALPLPNPVCFAISAVATFAMALPVGWLLFTLIEGPGNRLGRSIAARIAQWRVQETPPSASGMASAGETLLRP